MMGMSPTSRCPCGYMASGATCAWRSCSPWWGALDYGRLTRSTDVLQAFHTTEGTEMAARLPLLRGLRRHRCLRPPSSRSTSASARGSSLRPGLAQVVVGSRDDHPFSHCTRLALHCVYYATPRFGAARAGQHRRRLGGARLHPWPRPLLQRNARLRRTPEWALGDLVVQQAQPSPCVHQPSRRGRGHHVRSLPLPLAARPIA